MGRKELAEGRDGDIERVPRKGAAGQPTVRGRVGEGGSAFPTLLAFHSRGHRWQGWALEAGGMAVASRTRRGVSRPLRTPTPCCSRTPSAHIYRGIQERRSAPPSGCSTASGTRSVSALQDGVASMKRRSWEGASAACRGFYRHRDHLGRALLGLRDAAHQLRGFG